MTTAGEGAGRGFAPALAAAVAALTGFAMMALELTAVRLLAPHFGDSAYVWTNVIGVILVALALGAFLGGRMADRDHGRGRLSSLLIVAGLLAAVVPLLARPLGEWLLPGDVPMDVAMAALVRGSLTATTILFAPPVLLVGCVTPMLVKLLVDEHGRVGGASGLISAMSTIGSLLGTFAATHLLVPGIGSQATVWVCAGVLIVSGLLCLSSAKRAVALLPVVVLFFIDLGPMRSVPEGDSLVRETESTYQYLQVVKRQDERGRATILKINEGLDSFHSVAYEGTPYTFGAYYDYHVMAPFLAADGTAPRPLKAVSLGSAAGTFGRLYARVFPGCTVDAVELDPAVHELRQLFPGQIASGEEYSGVDARVFVDTAPAATYDVALVDTYERQIYIPAHIASRQFFEGVHRILKNGGVVSVNAGGSSFEDPAVGVLADTMAAVFGHAQVFRVPFSRNFVLVARKGEPGHWGVLKRVRTEDATLKKILADCTRAGNWRDHRQPAADQENPILDDDRPYLDVLQERLYAQSMAAPELLPMAGDQDPTEVETRAKGLLDRGEIEKMLQSLQLARAESGYLRYLAGYGRWALRDPEGAILEFQRAKALGQPDMDPQIEGATREAAPLRHAAQVGRRNGWLAVSLPFLLLAGVWFTGRRMT